MKTLWLAVILATTPAAVAAQSGDSMGSMPGMDHSQHAASAASSSSVAGYTAAERAAGIREGRGMGLALPAESNGYPGPRHVLELADQLGLSADQKARTQALFESMQAKAKQLGAQLLDEETALDRLFADGHATPALLDQDVHRIAQTEAALKIAHLETHLAMQQLLSRDQIAHYAELRRGGGGSGRTRPASDAPAAAEHAH